MMRGSCELLDVRAGAIVTAGRVDDDDGTPGGQHSKKRSNVSRLVAQHDSDAGGAHQRADVLRQRADLAPGEPVAFELDRLRRRVQGQDVIDALREGV